MSDNGKTIRFIGSDSKELFKIPDGGSINIIYPPGDDRGTVTRQCKFLDEMHIEISRNGSNRNVYHVAEFAERMEAIGARFEPETQLRNTEITPFSPGEEKFYTYNREEGNTCVGHIAGDFGNDGERFHSSWRNHMTKAEQDWSNCSQEFQTELHSAVYALRQDLLKDYSSMAAYCESHPEAMLDSGDTYKRYGFELETDTRQYYTQCFLGESMRDARFIVYAYDKPAPVLEQTQPNAEPETRLWEVIPGTADEREMFYRNDAKGDLNVGYLRGDFGKNGSEFHHSWFEGDNGKNTPEFKAEHQVIINGLRKDILKDLKSSQDYCYKHPEAQLPGDIHRYGFKVETKSRQYFVRCTVLPNDYFYVFAYEKAAVRVNEQLAGDKVNRETMIETVGKYEKSHRMADRNRLTWFHNDFGAYVLNDGITDERLSARYNEIMEKKAEKQSVLEQIKASRSEQKPPSAPKPERNKKKQETEL